MLAFSVLFLSRCVAYEMRIEHTCLLSLAYVGSWHDVWVPSRRTYDCYRMSTGLNTGPRFEGLGLRMTTTHVERATRQVDWSRAIIH
jgi:hypothetical protein